MTHVALVQHARRMRDDLNNELPAGVGNTIDALCDHIEATINSTPDSNALREACDAAFDFLGGVDDASEIRYQLLAALLSSDPGRVE